MRGAPGRSAQRRQSVIMALVRERRRPVTVRHPAPWRRPPTAARRPGRAPRTRSTPTPAPPTARSPPCGHRRRLSSGDLPTPAHAATSPRGRCRTHLHPSSYGRCRHEEHGVAAPIHRSRDIPRGTAVPPLIVAQRRTPVAPVFPSPQVWLVPPRGVPRPRSWPSPSQSAHTLPYPGPGATRRVAQIGEWTMPQVPDRGVGGASRRGPAGPGQGFASRYRWRLEMYWTTPSGTRYQTGRPSATRVRQSVDEIAIAGTSTSVATPSGRWSSPSS